MQSRIEQLELQVRQLQEQLKEMTLAHNTEIQQMQKESKSAEQHHITETNFLKQKLKSQIQEQAIIVKEKEDDKDFLQRQLQISTSKSQYLDKELQKERDFNKKLAIEKETLVEENQKLQQELKELSEKLNKSLRQPLSSMSIEISNINKASVHNLSPKPRALENLGTSTPPRRLSFSLEAPPSFPLNFSEPEPKKSWFSISPPKVSISLLN